MSGNHNSLNASIQRLIWLLPFISFASGYILFSFIYNPKKIATPTLVGAQVPDVFRMLSNYNLNLRILQEKKDADLPDSTIVRQTPDPGTFVKEHQTIFIVVTKQPEQPVTPHCIGKTRAEIKKLVTDKKIRTRVYFLVSMYPKDYCFAQYPQANEPFSAPYMILYISLGNKKPVIWPDFTNTQVDEVTDFLERHGLEATFIPRKKTSGRHSYTDTIVTDQHPLPGTLVYLNEKHPPHIQLQIR